MRENAGETFYKKFSPKPLFKNFIAVISEPLYLHKLVGGGASTPRTKPVPSTQARHCQRSKS